MMRAWFDRVDDFSARFALVLTPHSLPTRACARERASATRVGREARSVNLVRSCDFSGWGGLEVPQNKDPAMMSRGLVTVEPDGSGDVFVVDFALVGLAQHIAAAPDGLDVILATGGHAELLAELADEHV